MKKLLLSMTFVTTLVSGCSKKVPLVPLEQFIESTARYGQIKAQFCLPKDRRVKQKTKFIFVLDKSASNQGNGLDVVGTDSFGRRRYKPLFDFISQAADNPDTFYSLINFNDRANLVQNFTNDREVMRNKILSEWNALGQEQPRDFGYTNYLAALALIADTIKTEVLADQLNNPSLGDYELATAFRIVFLSDGYPRMPDPTNPDQFLDQPYDPDIKKLVLQILALRNDLKFGNLIDEIQLHTGYYYEKLDADAQQVLSNIAVAGNGEAHSFSSGRAIDFNLFAPPVRQVRFNLQDVFVDNRSSRWWHLDGKPRYLSDGDEDFVPDLIEISENSNPTVSDSDGNGVRDGVERAVHGRSCKDAACSSVFESRNNYSACAGMEVPGTDHDRFEFQDTDHDGLNDCEENILRTDMRTADTQGFGVPDRLAFQFGMNPVQGIKSGDMDPDLDGVSNYLEVKQGAPTFWDQKRILGFKPIEYRLQPSGNCYSLVVEEFPIVGPSDSIEIQFVAAPAAIATKKEYWTVISRFRNGVPVIEIKQEEFKK